MTDRTVGDNSDNPFRDPRSERDKPQPGANLIVRDESTNRQIRSQIGHLPDARQRQILEELRDVPSASIPDMLRAMRTRGLLAGGPPSATPSENERLSAEDWPGRNDGGDRTGFPDGRSGTRTGVDVSASGYSRSINSRDPSRRDEPDRPYSYEDRGSGFRGPEKRRESRNTDSEPRDSAPNGLGRSLLDNPLVRNLTGRSNPETRSGGPSGGVQPGRTLSGDNGSPVDGPQSAEPLSGEWGDALKRLIAITDARASKLSTPTEKNELEYIRNHVYLRMLYLMSGKQELAVAHIPRISPADQEFWQHTLWGMTDYFREDVLSSRGNRATQTVSHFRTAIHKLREQADLEVRHLVFCSKITSFGNYDTVPMKELRYEFRAGESVLIYAEVDNFKSELTEDDRYRTRLKSTIEIYRDVPAGAGDPVSFDFAPTKDICRTQRRDYFHSYIIKLPGNLSLGDYKLKLTIQDEVAGKMATETVRFRIN